MEERYLSVREFAEHLGVSRSTVISWIKSNRIIAYNVHGRWKIPYSEVEKILRGVQRIRRLAIYARVSSSAQKDDLERQVEALKLWTARNFPQAEYVVVTDIASGLNEDRSGLRKLIEMARRREVDAIVVAHEDRLARFGFEYLKTLFNALGVELFVAFEEPEEEPKGYRQELMEDFVEVVTSFAARIYGKRSRKYRKVVSFIEELVKGG
jgi:excisionase family DNA binding protein